MHYFAYFCVLRAKRADLICGILSGEKGPFVFADAVRGDGECVYFFLVSILVRTQFAKK